MINNKVAGLNDDLTAAEETGDAEKVKKMIGNDFVIVRATGVRQEREEYVKKIAENAGRGRKPEETKVQVYDRTALYSGVISTKKIGGAEGERDKFRNVRMWREEGGEWKCIYWQVTKVAPG